MTFKNIDENTPHFSDDRRFWWSGSSWVDAALAPPPSSVPHLMPPPNSQFGDQRRRLYGEWYVWARRYVGLDELRADLCAAIAMAVVEAGYSSTVAITEAARARPSAPPWTQFADQETQAYARWMWWAISTIGMSEEQAHLGAAAAVEAQREGSDPEKAATAARYAMGPRLAPRIPSPGPQATSHPQSAAPPQQSIAAAVVPTGSRRQQAFALARATCPLPIHQGAHAGVHLFEAEFLVITAKHWGFHTDRLILTTHRLIWSHGLVNAGMQSLYLADIQDVSYDHKALRSGSVWVESAGRHSFEGLVHIRNGKQFRDAVLQMVHWARGQRYVR